MRLSDMSAYEPPRKLEPKTPKATIKHNLRELEEKLNKARTMLESTARQKEENKKPAVMPQLKLFTCSEED